PWCARLKPGRDRFEGIESTFLGAFVRSSGFSWTASRLSHYSAGSAYFKKAAVYHVERLRRNFRFDAILRALPDQQIQRKPARAGLVLPAARPRGTGVQPA